MTDKITITRALPELKLLDKRIGKLISNSRFVDLYQNRKDLAIGSAVTKEVFEKNSSSSMKSITDLIERRKKIKSAILISNASVKVKIGEKEYTVIEAIERKNSISYEQSLLETMKAQLANVKSQIDRQKPQLEAAVRDMLEKNLEGDTKPSKEDYERTANPFLEANELNILDPCKIEEKIADLDKSIDEFLSEVDAALTESNSRTEIEV